MILSLFFSLHLAFATEPDCASRVAGNPKLEEIAALRAKTSSSPMWKEWDLALEKIQAIYALKGTFPANERKYFDLIIDGVKAAVEKHQLVYAKERHLNHLDYPRHRDILRAIAAFDSTKARWSLYRIKQAIEGRHSLTEYVNCK